MATLAFDPIPQRQTRTDASSGRTSAPAVNASPSSFDRLLDQPADNSPPPSTDAYDRSRTSDNRIADDRAAAKAADDRANTQARTRDAQAKDARAADQQRAADRQQAADDRSAADAARKRRDDASAPAQTQSSADTKPAKDQKAADTVNTQSGDQPSANANDAAQAPATDAQAQQADPAAAKADAKKAKADAAAVIADAATATSDKPADPTAKTATDAAPTPDPSTVQVQVPVVAVPVAPLPTLDPSIGAASTTPAEATIEAAGTGTKQKTPTTGGADQAAAAAGDAVETAASDAKTADPARQAAFDTLLDAAGAKKPADGKTEQTGKAKAASPEQKTASADAAKQAAPDGVQTAEVTDAQPAKGATAAHQTHSQFADRIAATGRPSGEARADVSAISAAPQAGGNAPILQLNLAQPATLPLSTMFQVSTPKTDAASAVDVAVPVAGLAVEIVSRAQEGGKHFDIRLDPPELGRVDVRLSVEDNGKVTSHLVVERAETLDLLRRDQPQLERALQQAGLNTDGGLQFSLRDQNSSAQRDQTPRDNGGTPSHIIIPDDEAAAADAARRGYGRLLGRAGGVDIRI